MGGYMVVDRMLAISLYVDVPRLRFVLPTRLDVADFRLTNKSLSLAWRLNHIQHVSDTNWFFRRERLMSM